MDDLLAGETSNGIPADHHSQTTRSAKEHTDIADTARDADIMMHMIVGSLSPDPDEVRRGLAKKQNGRSSTSAKDLNIGLVILAVFLIFLVFGFDLVFLKM